MILEPAAAAVKLALYLGIAIGAGTALARASLGRGRAALDGAPARQRIRWSAVLMMVAACAGVLLLVLRLGEGFDPSVLSAVLDGPVGLAAALQVGGGVLLLAGAARGSAWPVAGATAALSSFAVTGHTASLGVGAGLVAAAHVGAAAWWLGGLLLVRSACRAHETDALAALVARFSFLALPVVGALALGGLIAAIALVGASREAWLSPYGRDLALKIALAAVAVSVAAYNRLRLVPRLAAADARAAGALRRSVTLEVAVLCGVLAATAWLTTFRSPHEH